VAELEPRPCIDTHVHLDDAAFDQDREAVLAASRDAGVTHFINIGFMPSSWESSAQLRARHPQIEIVLGLHPGHADMWSDALATDLEEAVLHLRPLAIGETGFDFARPQPEFEQQTQAFRGQLALAVETKLPVVIHQRMASGQIASELERWPGVRALVLHSFDGDDRYIDWAIDRGCFIGVGGLAARKSSDGLRKVLKRAPLERILLETDSPYLTPPGSASRRNSPANLPRIAEILAPIWNLAARELVDCTRMNTLSLFGDWGVVE
jgi:TatD DNase family protein